MHLQSKPVELCGDELRGFPLAEGELRMTVQVPLFVKTDDVIRVDTRTDSYLERV